jgi:plastocyanin
MEAGSMFELGAVVIYPVIIGVAIAQLGIGETTHAEEPTPQASVSAPAPGASDTIVAKGFAFDVTEVELPAGETVPYTLDNQDTAAHNFAIYASEADGLAKKDPLFTGADVAAGASVTYDVTAPEKGKYHFQCDIHPSMKGTLITT